MWGDHEREACLAAYLLCPIRSQRIPRSGSRSRKSAGTETRTSARSDLRGCRTTWCCCCSQTFRRETGQVSTAPGASAQPPRSEEARHSRMRRCAWLKRQAGAQSGASPLLWEGKQRAAGHYGTRLVRGASFCPLSGNAGSLGN